LALDEPKENETMVKVDDINILVSNDIIRHAEGSQIDYLNYKEQGWFTVERLGHKSC
jgi:Fe-S cluster assembly iron-binding protein IscA